MRILFFLLFPIFLSAQINRAYGVVEIGSFPTSSPTGPKLAYRPVDSSFYRWVSGNTWVKIIEPSIIPDTLYITEEVGTSYKISGDTLHLTPYLLKSDTSAMLVKYIERGDTLGMLSAYIRSAGWGLLKSAYTLRADSTLLATKLFAKNLPTYIASGYIATSNGSNLVARNLFDNNTAVSILNSKPFLLGQWTTAGRPTGVNGYIGYNTSFNWLDIYSSAGWFSPARAATTGGAFTSGYIPFGGTGGLTEDLGISWDNTNKGLSIKSSTTSNSRGIQVLQQTNDGIGAFNSQVKNRGSLANAVQNGDALGSFGFGGSDGSAYQFTATIQGRTVGSVSTNVVPTDLIFNTSATNTLSLTERMRITSVGNVGVTSGSFSITGMTSGSIFFSGSSGLFTQDNSNLFWDKTNKRMLIGSATNNISQLSVTNSTSTTTTRGISIIQQTNDTVSTLINLYKSRGSISNAVSNGDKVGSIAFSATDGGTYHQSLRMRAEIDGTVSTNNVPMALTFGSRLNNAVGFTEWMRLTSIGNLLIGTQTDVSRTLHLSGTARITGSAGTATAVMGRDANGDISNLSLSGLSITSGVLSATWLKPQLEAGSVTINSAANADLFINNLDSVRFGKTLIRSSNNGLLILNPDVGSSGISAFGAGYHTVLNGTLNGSDGGTGNIIIGGVGTANTTGTNFMVSLGYASNVSGAYAIGLGYNADATTDNSLAIGRNALANEIGEISLGSNNYTKLNLWAGGTNGVVNVVNYGLGNREATDLSKTQSNYLAAYATDNTLVELGIGSGLKRSGGVLDVKHKSLIDSLPLASVSIDASGNDLEIIGLNSLNLESESAGGIITSDGDITDMTPDSEFNAVTGQDAVLNLTDMVNLHAPNADGVNAFRIQNEGFFHNFTNTLGDLDSAFSIITDGDRGLLKAHKYGNGYVNATQTGEYPGKYILATTANHNVMDYRIDRDTLVVDANLSVGTLLYYTQNLHINLRMTALAATNSTITFPDASDAFRGKSIHVRVLEKDPGIYVPVINVAGGVSRLLYTNVTTTAPTDQANLTMDNATWPFFRTYKFTCLNTGTTPNYRWVLNQ